MKQKHTKTKLKQGFNAASFEELCETYYQGHVDTLFGKDRFQAALGRTPDGVQLKFFQQDEEANSLQLYVFFATLLSEHPTLQGINFECSLTTRNTPTIIIEAPDSMALSILTQAFFEQYTNDMDGGAFWMLAAIEEKAIEDVRLNFGTSMMGRPFAAIPPAHMLKAFMN